MSKSSRKGNRREHEWANLVGGEKKSRLGYKGPDVHSLPMKLTRRLEYWEVKSDEKLPLWLIGVNASGEEGWLTQMEREGADAVVFRQNRGKWYMIVPLPDPVEDLVVGETVCCGDCGVDYKCACHMQDTCPAGGE